MALDSILYSDSPDVTFQIQGDAWGIVEAKVELSKWTTPDYIDFIAVPLPETVEKLPNDLDRSVDEGGILNADLTLDIETDIVSERDSGNQQTRIFTGKLANISTAPKGAFEGLAYNPAHQSLSNNSPGSLYNTTIDVSLASGATDIRTGDSPERPRIGYSDLPSRDAPSSTRVKVKPLLNFIMDKSDVLDDNYTLHLQNGGYNIGGTNAGKNLQLYFSDNDVTVHRALQYAKNMSNSAAWFDRWGTFHFGAPQPNEHVFRHGLQFITDTTDGLTTPPYRSVRVIGSGVVSQSGWSRAAMIEETPVVVERNIDSREGGDALAEPTFVYRNMSIVTQEQAETAADNIRNKLKEQRGSGKVTVVGMPEVRPFDGIVMPSSQKQPMGGRTYGVGKVIHKINDSDGFLTDIHVTGVTDFQDEVLSSEDVEQIAQSYYNQDRPRYRAWLKEQQDNNRGP